MTAFRDYYIKDVEKELGHAIDESDIEFCKSKYIKGWHPSRLAKHLKDKYSSANSRKCLFHEIENCDLCLELKRQTLIK